MSQQSIIIHGTDSPHSGPDLGRAGGTVNPPRMGLTALG